MIMLVPKFMMLKMMLKMVMLGLWWCNEDGFHNDGDDYNDDDDDYNDDNDDDDADYDDGGDDDNDDYDDDDDNNKQTFGIRHDYKTNS